MGVSPALVGGENACGTCHGGMCRGGISSYLRHGASVGGTDSTLTLMMMPIYDLNPAITFDSLDEPWDGY